MRCSVFVEYLHITGPKQLQVFKTEVGNSKHHASARQGCSCCLGGLLRRCVSADADSACRAEGVPGGGGLFLLFFMYVLWRDSLIS